MNYKWISIVKSAVCLAFLIASSPLQLVAAEKSENPKTSEKNAIPDEVKAAKEKYARVLQKNFEKAALSQMELKAKFLKELEEEMQKMQKSGKLRETVALKKRIEEVRNDAGLNLKKGDPKHDYFQKKLAKIETDKVEEDLKDTEGYIKYLKKQIAAATKNGKLELGLAFDKELKKVEKTAGALDKALEPEPTAHELRIVKIEKALGYKLKEHPLGAKAAPKSAKAEGFKGHYYKLIRKAMSWTDAMEYCKSKGGYLVCPTSSEENEFIWSLYNSNMWLGGTDENKEGRWGWITSEEWIFSQWKPGQPNNKKGNEHFLVTGKIQKGWWDDSNRYKLAFICEWEK